MKQALYYNLFVKFLLLLTIMKINVLLFCFSFFACHLVGAQTFEQKCKQSLPSPSVKVNWTDSKIQYSFEKTVSELTKMQSIYGESVIYGGLTIGLTLAQFKYSVKYSQSILTQGSLTCFSPSIEINLSVSPQIVYIASEFPAGSCSFDVIANHELRHVNANQAQVQKIGPILQSQLSSQLAATPYQGNYPAWKSAFEQNISNKIMPYISTLFDEVLVFHKNIDSVEEYQKNKTVCNEEIPLRLKMHGLFY